MTRLKQALADLYELDRRRAEATRDRDAWCQKAADRAHELGIAYAERDMARRERDDLKAAVEGLATTRIRIPDEYSEAERPVWIAGFKAAQEWAAALLTPPDSGRDVG